MTFHDSKMSIDNLLEEKQSLVFEKKTFYAQEKLKTFTFPGHFGPY